MTTKFVVDCRRMLEKKKLNLDYVILVLGKENWNIL